MKSLKELVMEAVAGNTIIESEESEEFEDSSYATNHMETLAAMIEDPRLMAWAKIAEFNCNVKLVKDLNNAIKAFGKFYETMNSMDC